MNDDLLKVIAGLECCGNADGMVCGCCPYNDGRRFGVRCIRALMTDALEILREVESDGLY